AAAPENASTGPFAPTCTTSAGWAIPGGAMPGMRVVTSVENSTPPSGRRAKPSRVTPGGSVMAVPPGGPSVWTVTVAPSSRRGSRADTGVPRSVIAVWEDSSSDWAEATSASRHTAQIHGPAHRMRTPSARILTDPGWEIRALALDRERLDHG